MKDCSRAILEGLLARSTILEVFWAVGTKGFFGYARVFWAVRDFPKGTSLSDFLGMHES